MTPLPTGLPTTLLPALLNLLPSGVVYYTPCYDAAGAVVDFTFTYLNAAAQRQLGLPAQPTVTYLQQWPGSVESGAWAFHRDTFLAGKPDFFEQYFQTEDYAFNIQAHACRVEAGLLVTFADVTKQPRLVVEETLRRSLARGQAARAAAEAALQEVTQQRAILQDLLAQAPVAIGLFQGPEVRITAANLQMAALWGRTPEQTLGRPLLEAVPELAGQGFDDLLRQVLTTQVPVVGTETPATMLRDGVLKTTYYNFVYQPLYAADGSVVGVIDVAVDVTEQVEARRQLEQLNQELEDRVRERTRQLHEQQAQLQRIFEQAPVAIFVLSGPTHIIEVVNPLMSTMLGHPVAELLGRPYFEAVPELATQGYPEYLAQVQQTRRPVTVAESPAHLTYHQPGEIGYFTFVYQPLFDAADALTGVMCVTIDVTMQVRARQQVQHLNHDLAASNEELQIVNEELSESNTQLLRTNADLDSFIYTASHDLKSPIANIEGLLYALHHELPTVQLAEPTTAHLLALMQESIARFQTTIEQLTNVMQLQNSGASPAEELDVAALVESIRLDLAPSLEEARAQLLVDVAECPRLRFAAKDLRSILFNLLSNAIKYRSPERPLVVQLRTACTLYQATLTVQDNGLGLTPGQQQGMFELFRRFHTHVEGTGVGLYSIKKLIDNARGTITVQSELRVGTTFTVTLPR